MDLSFCSFSSGSSGNCYMVKTETTTLLVDAGISGKKIFEGLEKTATSIESVAGILITHEHSDHIKSLRIVTKKALNIKAYANAGTWSAIEGLVAQDKQVCFTTGQEFYIGDIKIRSFLISHDAREPVGYSFFAGGRQISIVTDTGYLTDEIMYEVRNADLLILEANHEVGMLQYCRYPFYIKQRILGDKGHLSNVAAAEGLCRLLQSRMDDGKDAIRVLLAHLSRENNEPSLAHISVKNILAESDFYIGKNIWLDIILRDQLSAIYEL